MPSSEKKKKLRILIFTFVYAFFLLFILMSFYQYMARYVLVSLIEVSLLLYSLSRGKGNSRRN